MLTAVSDSCLYPCATCYRYSSLRQPGPCPGCADSVGMRYIDKLCLMPGGQATVAKPPLREIWSIFKELY